MSSTTFADEYEVMEKLGAGHYATVYKCKQKATGNLYAVKVLERSKTSAKAVGEALAETNVLRQISHRHCIQLEHVYDEPTQIMVVMEIISGGELFQKICKEKHFSEKLAAKTLQSLLEALAYLHGKGIIHRDLKPENIMLTTSDDKGILKLVDFGFADTPGPTATTLTKCCGTPLYIAPEVLNCGLFKTGPPYGVQADVWSAGVIAYILLCGYPPFRGKSQTDQFKKIVDGKFDFPEHKVWGTIAPEAKDLISKMLVLNPADRITASEALNHPWLKTNNDTPLAETVEGISNFSASQAWKRGIFGVEAVHRMLYLQRCTMLKVKPNTQIERLLTEAQGEITTLDLSKNYVGPKGLLALLEMIEKNHHVKHLIFGNNGANNAVVERLCTIGRTHPSMETIDLSHNPISHLAGRMILYMLQCNNNIVGLKIEGTVMQPAMIARIALQLHRNQEKKKKLEEGGGVAVPAAAAAPAAAAPAATAST